MSGECSQSGEFDEAEPPVAATEADISIKINANLTSCSKMCSQPEVAECTTRTSILTVDLEAARRSSSLLRSRSLNQSELRVNMASRKQLNTLSLINLRGRAIPLGHNHTFEDQMEYHS